MALRVDWDTYEVVESEDFTPQELWETAEQAREEADDWYLSRGQLPMELEELMEQLEELEGAQND